MHDTICVHVYYAIGRCLCHLCFVHVICAVTVYYCCCPLSSSSVIFDMLACLVFILKIFPHDASECLYPSVRLLCSLTF